MTDRNPTHSSPSPRIVSSGALESTLRAQAMHARHTPSSRLRQRTLSALRELPSPGQAENSSHRRRAFAAIALCACALIASIVAFTLPRQSGSTEPIVIKGTEPALVHTISRDRPVKSMLPSSNLSYQVSLKNPLMTEARLLAQDARQTYAVFQANLPQKPKFQQAVTSPASHRPAISR